MRTLVREGAWVFIVVGVDPFSLEYKSFSYRSLLWAYFAGSFPYRDPS